MTVASAFVAGDDEVAVPVAVADVVEVAVVVAEEDVEEEEDEEEKEGFFRSGLPGGCGSGREKPIIWNGGNLI